jgi:AbrB family looped-hinge helix DNA binding protein
MTTASERPGQQIEEIEFVKKGQVTIPKRLRDEYNLTPGSKGVLISVDGAFLIVPGKPETPKLLDQIRDGLGTEGMSLEEMIVEMRQLRDTSDYEG